MSIRLSRRRLVAAAGSVAATALTAGCAPWTRPRPSKHSKLRLSARSPNGVISASLSLAGPESGAVLSWEVRHMDRPVLLPGPLGLVLPDGRELGTGARVLGHRRVKLEDRWKPPYGIQAEYGGSCEELTLALTDAPTAIEFDLIVRVYDAGVALRWIVRHGPASQLILAGERTTFKLPRDAQVYASRDEGEYQITSVAALAPVPDPPLTRCSDSGALADIPVAVRIGDQLTAVITESDRRHYPRAMLKTAPGDPDALVTHLMRYPGRADGWSGPGETPAADTFALRIPCALPWRVMLIATAPGAIIENAGLVTSLSSANELGDLGWIRPGRAIRAFRQNTTQAGLAHIDFAVKHKLQYIEFDAHWYGDGTDPSDALVPLAGLDLNQVIDYGRARGVGVIVYVDRVPAQSQIESIVAQYRQWGVAGIKFGFMWEGRQADNDFLEEIVRKCGRNRLLVNLHDNLRPAGLERTFPNTLTVEGVRGNEHFPTARHNVTLPFIRNVAGPMDYTICYAHEKNRTTNAHQLAMAVVYYSPLTFLYWYDKPAKYADSGWPDLSWFDECPVTWDETRVLSGNIGEHIIIARRSGERWFVGAMTNEEPRYLVISLSFLGPGRWRAHIYADGTAAVPARNTPVEVSERGVDSQQQLELILAAAGGQAVRFEPHAR